MLDKTRSLNTALGVLALVPPEVEKGGEIGAEMDTWNLGVLFHRLIFNRDMFVESKVVLKASNVKGGKNTGTICQSYYEKGHWVLGKHEFSLLSLETLEFICDFVVH